jgi:hypothetical protein
LLHSIIVSSTDYQYYGLETYSSSHLITKMNITYDGYPSNATANDIHYSLGIWLVSSPSSSIVQDRITEIQRQISIRGAYKLLPAFQGTGLVSLGMLQYGPSTWLTYNIGMLFLLVLKAGELYLLTD